MLNEKIREKVLKIMELGLELNSKEKNTVFVEYFGHCYGINTRIYYNGWNKETTKDFEECVYLDLPEAETKLDKIIKKIKELKGE